MYEPFPNDTPRTAIITIAQLFGAILFVPGFILLTASCWPLALILGVLLFVSLCVWLCRTLKEKPVSQKSPEEWETQHSFSNTVDINVTFSSRDR